MRKEKIPRKIYLYPSVFKLHTSYRTLLDRPPQGYLFVTGKQSMRKKSIEALKKNAIAKWMYHLYIRTFKSSTLFERAIKDSKPLPQDINLVFSMGTIYRGTHPYIMEILDNPFSITGYNYDLFMKNKELISSDLESENCKRIICSHETALSFMKQEFPPAVASKCVLVRSAIEECSLHLIPHRGFCLLFVGSTTNPDDFYIKGGLEALNAFEQASLHNDISLIIRCKIPPELVHRIKSQKKITVIENEIPYSQLQQLYISSDVFILPGHHFHLMAMLEAMSYGLPILALDSYAFEDFIQSGKNGFLIKKSDKIKGYNDKSYPTNVKTSEFLHDIKRGDERVINELAEKIEFLANHSATLRKMSKHCKSVIRKRFSISGRNRALKAIFDSALKQTAK